MDRIVTGKVNLGEITDAFAQGGNRLCFFHPTDDAKCIKILRPDRTPQIRRQQKRYFKRLRPLSRYDENVLESKEITSIHQHIGEKAFECIPQCFGWLETNHGKGLVLELIRDEDERVSITLKQYLWLHGMTESLKQMLELFYSKWTELGIPSKDLLLHNIVVQQQVSDNKPNVKRLVVIDGFGWAGLSLPFLKFDFISRKRALKKTKKLSLLINDFLKKEKDQSNWGYHGWLEEHQRVKNHE